MSQVETIPENIPAVSVAVDVPDRLKPIDVDLSSLSDILVRDFPGKSPEDWSRVMVRLFADDAAATSSCGFVGTLRNSPITRLHLRLSSALGLNSYSEPSFKRRVSQSGGKDILIEVDLEETILDEDRAAEGFTVADIHPFLHEYQEIDGSRVLAHETHHASEMLDKYPNDDELKQIERDALADLTALGGVAAGTSVVIGSFFAKVGGFVSPRESLAAASAGLVLMLGSSVVGRILSMNQNSSWRYNGGGEEDRAHAYVIATESSWEGVIKTGGTIE
jgi:hypothetical protein